MTKEEAKDIVDSYGGYEEVEWLLNNNLMYVLNPKHKLNKAFNLLKGEQND